MRRVNLYAIIMIYWMVFMQLSALFTRAFLNGLLEITSITKFNNPLVYYLTSPFQQLEAIIFGLFFGVLFIAIHELSEKINLNTKNFGRIIFFKSVMYLIGFALSAVLVYSIVGNFSIFPKESIKELIHLKSFQSLFFIGLSILAGQTFLLNFIVQAIVKFGQNNLLNFLTGKYRAPIVEDRVFLFIDLKSSTTIAEQLGSIKYSRLIKSCFDEVNKLVDKYKADIYQYVGDEVVLTWRTDKVIKNHNHLKLYYALQEAFEKRSRYYQKKYGVVPEFKAGVHGGLVTVTEIGNIKRDIAYHGDVLNTASRIQGLCNEHNESLLTSGELLARLESINGYQVRHIGEITLKGKTNAVAVSAVRKLERA
ncbi:adenylate/guanylate cyclase domain-containing protein [Fulvivirga sp. RKSG066]|uniref:adenylate/guanylate cyclase domain-containing protein n=1 Tax=Fulvivirga aurantia TaxID=2529383 RepID=UPI0012BB718A|nr:adenylate/guanylate cyclase domain-containing protein [Fulvivirga aurantia]MTI22902.1 adenylate/guanylate cyclase domain-containing protein [Fulvivirga aurantia]